ncbi:MAG: sulfurtransferase [Deltaproteobacteria bacterium]|nr:sulfurtransferase [Deltaproteobacteria bacterium]
MLTDAHWLAQYLNKPDLRIIDCRYVLGKPSAGKALYLEGHIPGAIHLDVDHDLSGKQGPGRHPLPKAIDFSTTMSNAGVDQDTTVIAYDDMGGAWSARLWWLLRYFGHEKVFILNGGWLKWIAENNEVTKVVPHFKPRSFKAVPHTDWIVSKEEVQRNLENKDCLLLDARAPERYRGEIHQRASARYSVGLHERNLPSEQSEREGEAPPALPVEGALPAPIIEPLDQQAGHIPGAKNAPFAENVTQPNKEFKSLEELKEKFKTLGACQAKEIICYCGSGVTACNNIFALKMIGKDAKLYEGSWSDWSADPNLPVERP